jgi:pimeloyl-ACP methyl ester carboxylesterase
MRFLTGCLLALLLPCCATAKSTPLRFTVENVNRSALPCPADGGRYELSGRLVTPPGAAGRSVTLYLHEYSFASHFWSFPDDRYDYAAALAREGHASVVIDRLGYGASATPDGTATCLGAQADMAHQVVQQLRARGYQRVVLAGHSVGGSVAELAYHSFGGVDALAFFGWAHTGYSTPALRESFIQGGVCTRGGEEKRPGGPGGYAFYGQRPEDLEGMSFFDAEPAIVSRMKALRERDPCGDVATLVASVAFNRQRASQVKVPILLVMGEEDRVFEPGTAEEQRDTWTGSPEVTLFKQPRASHALTLEKTAPQMRAAVARWLTRKGYADRRGESRDPAASPAPAAQSPRTKAAKKKPRAKKRCRKARRVSRRRSRRRGGARTRRACRARARAERGRRTRPAGRRAAAS